MDLGSDPQRTRINDLQGSPDTINDSNPKSLAGLIPGSLCQIPKYLQATEIDDKLATT